MVGHAWQWFAMAGHRWIWLAMDGLGAHKLALCQRRQFWLRRHRLLQSHQQELRGLNLSSVPRRVPRALLVSGVPSSCQWSMALCRFCQLQGPSASRMVHQLPPAMLGHDTSRRFSQTTIQRTQCCGPNRRVRLARRRVLVLTVSLTLTVSALACQLRPAV